MNSFPTSISRQFRHLRLKNNCSNEIARVRDRLQYQTRSILGFGKKKANNDDKEIERERIELRTRARELGRQFKENAILEREEQAKQAQQELAEAQAREKEMLKPHANLNCPPNERLAIFDKIVSDLFKEHDITYDQTNIYDTELPIDVDFRFELMKRLYKETAIRMPDTLLVVAKTLNDIANYVKKAPYGTVKEQKAIVIPITKESHPNVHIMGKLSRYESKFGGNIKISKEQLLALREDNFEEFLEYKKKRNITGI